MKSFFKVNQIEEFTLTAEDFLARGIWHLKQIKYAIENCEIDHLCYRVESVEAYQAWKEMLETIGTLEHESNVNGRPIALYNLDNPIQYEQWSVDLLELPSPKSSSLYKEGFQHFEVVTNESFMELEKKFSHLKLDRNALKKEINPDLEIIFPDLSVKFHHQNLRKVIEWEKK